MAFLLDSENVFAYLVRVGLWDEGQRCDVLSPQPGKNFSLRIKSGDDKAFQRNRDLLVKQEMHDPKGVAFGEVLREWWFYQLLGGSVEASLESERFGLESLRSRIIYPLHFDTDSSIIVFPFLSDVCDLSDFYRDFCKDLADGDSRGSSDEGANSPVVRGLPTAIAASLGENFAELHGSTFQNQYCETFSREKHWAEWSKGEQPSLQAKAKAVRKPTFLAGLARITPEMFCVIPTDALKFFRFYQRYPEIGAAIEALNHSFLPNCVVHNDPRFANFLLHDFQSFQLSLHSFEAHPAKATVRLIDWEKWNWGDPAYDLGQLIANYLQLWLKSLPVSSNLDLATTLSRAKVPLVAVQPSIAALIQAYFENFPQILSYRPDFLLQLMRFTGLGLIRQVQLYISHKQPLGNVEMAMVQVAKSLLCQPEASIPTVFGQSKAALESVVVTNSTQTVG
jgi:hypothetical protein